MKKSKSQQARVCDVWMLTIGRPIPLPAALPPRSVSFTELSSGR